MAYDPNSAYEPPKRAYYGQMQHHPAPAPNVSRTHVQEQYGQYSLRSQDGGYQHQYDQYNNYGGNVREGRFAQSPQYDDGYRGGYQKHKAHADTPPNTYEEQERRQERQYDPRFQQRPERGRQPPPIPPILPSQAARPNPKNARLYPQASQAQQQTQQQPPLRAQGNVSRPQTAPHAARGQDSSKMTMEEWKAKERAKMQADAMLPETLAWDNAFPTFPTKRETSRPSTANRESVELEGSPPFTTQRQEERPSTTRGNSYNSDPTPQTDSQQQYSGRPTLDHKPYSFEPISNRLGPQQNSPSAPQGPQYERRPSELGGSPVHELPPQQPPVAEQRQPPPSMRVESRQPPSGPDTAAQQYIQEAPRPIHDGRNSPQQSRNIQPRGPPMAAIDTGQPSKPQRPVYMDHQPLSPANVPQRPSTSQGPRTPLSHSITSPNTAYSQTHPPHTNYGAQAPAQTHPRHGSLNDIYGDYGDNRVAAPATAPPRTREEEIEAEMPDFDSAAPGGTSLLHKRSQHSQRPPVGSSTAKSPQMANLLPQQMNPSAPSLPAQTQRFHNQQVDPSSKSLPEQQRPKQKQGGITDGFVFELPGGNMQQQTYDDQYLQGMPRQYDTPHELPGPPIQPPFARDQRPRKSMDEAKQLPHHQGPPQPQRVLQNSRPPRGPYPPQQRPDLDRNFSDPQPQPAYSNIAQERIGSAPPTRQAFHEPPGRTAYGAPLTQQRSAPERPGHMHRYSNPDSLPQHPAPVRPGLLERGEPQQSKPPPVRNYANAATPSHQRQNSLDQSPRPVTAAELDQLRAAVDANPNNSKQALLLVKKLIEAAEVLASEGGRADPRTIAKNRERYIFDAHKRLKKLVTAGHPDAQVYLADCYGQGALGLEVDTKEAFNLYQAAAKAGHSEAAYRTAMCCEMGAEDGGGARKDYAKAVQWYRRAAALGDASAMFKVGVISLKGLLGQQKNVGEGVTWLKRAAESGDNNNPQAFYELATLYESTNTSPEVRNKVLADDQYALELFQKSANLGHKFAQFRLGQAYEYGSMGVSIDNRASISWYSKAAAQGEHQAELALSGWYLTGAEGILEHSDTEAYLWARKAASSEPPLAKAMFAMGYFTETGIGCPASIEEAKKWYGRAASYRFPKAQERLEELRKSGTKGPKPVNGKLSRKDQKKDEAECVIM